MLVRGMDSYPRTKGPMWNGAAVLTIPQAKGLEFDDVFIMNFFNDSPACKEWRILMSYIAELEEEGGSSTNGALRDVEVMVHLLKSLTFHLPRKKQKYNNRHVYTYFQVDANCIQYIA